MDNRPVGIFDSGLGGLTAVRALRALLPEEDFIYFADSGRAPYGGRSAEQLRRMCRQDMDLVAGFGVKAILVACGTLSSNAAELIRQYPVPAFGVLEPGIAAMAELPEEGPLAVIATEASIRSGAFARALGAACPGREILAVPCPDFVPLIESGHSAAEDPLLQAAVERDLAPLQGTGVRAILLGCTHFGIIEKAIAACVGETVRLISAADCAAAQLYGYLERRGLAGGSGQERYLTSGSGERFAREAALFLGRELTGAIEEVPVMEV